MRKLLHRVLNRQTMTYMFFGFLTTIINYVAFWCVITIFGQQTALSANVVAFVFSVVFAYLTSKLFVFHSRSWKKDVLLREICSFFGARILSFAFEELGLLICLKCLDLGSIQIWRIDGMMIAKISLSVIVVLVNYFLSKFFIFKS